jgi:hypothetical protein
MYFSDSAQNVLATWHDIIQLHIHLYVYFYCTFFTWRYAHDEEAADDQEESGWKYIHGDVFRFPKNKSLFSAALGTGTQLFAL